MLDTKRSNAINIGLKVLPTARTIKGAILKMDSSVINKEGIEVMARQRVCLAALLHGLVGACDSRIVSDQQNEGSSLIGHYCIRVCQREMIA